jgi:hypothetical protein
MPAGSGEVVNVTTQLPPLLFADAVMAATDPCCITDP